MKLSPKTIILIANIFILIGALLFALTQSYIAIVAGYFLSSLLKFLVRNLENGRERSTMLLMSALALLVVILVQIIW